MILLFFVHTFCMIILYVLLVAYILAINFYAFLLIKSLKLEEEREELRREGMPLMAYENEEPKKRRGEGTLGKLCITGVLGGAITIYLCMFLFKYRRGDLFLMVLMPLLGVLNIYLFVLLFRSGFGFLFLVNGG